MNWKQIETPFETNHEYFVNEAGQVLSVSPSGKRSIIKGKVVEGSLHIDLCLKGNHRMRKVVSIAQLVANLFIPKPPLENLIVMHINDDCKDNRVENLMWIPRENFGLRHASNIERYHSNEPKYSKVTADQVADIKKLIASGKTKAWCAKQYGISAMQVTRIVRGENWKVNNQ